jgi:hydrogenase maturation protease
MSGRVLVAGIGNIFQSDDAFGVEVVRRLADASMGERVRVEDFGIRGVHLAYELLEGYSHLVLIDAVPMGEAPGTVALIEPLAREAGAVPIVDAHTMNPDVVLQTLAGLGGRLDQVFVIGCEPESVEEGMGLTPRVEASLDDAIRICHQVVRDIIASLEQESIT